MNPQEKLREDIRKFLEVYKVLLPEGKAQFEAQMAKAAVDQDERTKSLYSALVKAAKDGLDIDEAILEMQQSQG